MMKWFALLESSAFSVNSPELIDKAEIYAVQIKRKAILEMPYSN
jgi:hypothetical protein